MQFRGSKTSNEDSYEIKGRVKSIDTSPSGQKRVEVEAEFKKEIKADDPSLPAYMQPPPDTRPSPRDIKVDMSHDEARGLKTDDEIRARIRDKYSKSARGGGCGLGAHQEIYNHVETLAGSEQPSKGNSRWDRFKGKA
jgi:hypothetical protein